jgi:hypothetical protein
MRSLRDALLGLAFLVLGLIVAAVTWDVVHKRTFGQNEGTGFGGFGGSEDTGRAQPQRMVWVKFALVSLDDAVCQPLMLKGGKRLTMANDQVELTRGEATELYSHLERLRSFELVGSASGETIEGQQMLVQFVDDIPFVEWDTRNDKAVDVGTSKSIGVRLQFWPEVSADGATITLKGMFPEAGLPGGWTQEGDNLFGKPLVAGWSVTRDLTVPRGGCLVVTGLNPLVLPGSGHAAQRFVGCRGVLFVSATVMPFTGKNSDESTGPGFGEKSQ